MTTTMRRHLGGKPHCCADASLQQPDRQPAPWMVPSVMGAPAGSRWVARVAHLCGRAGTTRA